MMRAARLWAKRLYLRLGGSLIEYCKECGRQQPVIWTVNDTLWGRVTGRWDGGGVLCVECFDRRAWQTVGPLRWSALPLDDDVCRTCFTGHEMMADCAPSPSTDFITTSIEVLDLDWPRHDAGGIVPKARRASE